MRFFRTDLALAPATLLAASGHVAPACIVLAGTAAWSLLWMAMTQLNPGLAMVMLCLGLAVRLGAAWRPRLRSLPQLRLERHPSVSRIGGWRLRLHARDEAAPGAAGLLFILVSEALLILVNAVALVFLLGAIIASGGTG